MIVTSISVVKALDLLIALQYPAGLELGGYSMLITFNAENWLSLKDFAAIRNGVARNESVHIHGLNGGEFLFKRTLPKQPVRRMASFCEGKWIMGRGVQTCKLKSDRIGVHTTEMCGAAGQRQWWRWGHRADRQEVHDHTREQGGWHRVL